MGFTTRSIPLSCLFLTLILNHCTNGVWAFLFRPSARSEAVWTSLQRDDDDSMIAVPRRFPTTTTTSIHLYDSKHEENEHVLPLMQLAQAHFASQALYTAVQLGIPDIIGDTCNKSIDDIAMKMEEPQPNKEALLRTLRLLVAVGILTESVDDDNDDSDTSIQYGLSPTGALLQTTHESSMASFVSHWTEPAMWNAWSMLPAFVAGNVPIESSPFQAANNNMTLAEYYRTHPTSAQYRNDVAKFVSSNEIPAILDAYDWNSLVHDKIVVDIGGGYGTFARALVTKCPSIQKCYCLDLASVIADAHPLDNVDMIAGDMFDVSTIPPCNVIFMKHVLCDWSDKDAVTILRNCHYALESSDGVVVLLDALITSGEEAVGSRQVQTYIDALLMVVGSRMERSHMQLSHVARQAGFAIETVVETESPSVNITILSKV